MSFWIAFTVVSLFWGIVTLLQKNPSRFFSDLYVVLLWFIAAFRYNIGTDYTNYEVLYYVLNSQDFILNDSIINVIIYALRELNFKSQMLFVVYETIIVAFLYSGIRYFAKNEKQVMLALLIYAFFPRCYFNSMNQIKQAVSISIIFWSAKYIIERKFFSYLCSVIIATLFHFSAVIFVLLYFWKVKNPKVRSSLFYVFVFFILRYLGLAELIIDKVVNYIPGFDEYLKYANGYNNKTATISGVFYVVLPLYILILSVKPKLKDIKILFLINMTFLGVCFIAIVSGQSAVARFRDYFLLFFAVGFGIYIDEWIKQYKSYLPYAFAVLMSLYFLNSLDNLSNGFGGDAFVGESSGNIEYEFNFDLYD